MTNYKADFKQMPAKLVPQGEAKKITICGVTMNEITKNGAGVQQFDSLEDAKKVFPDLDEHKNGKRFTCGMEHGTRFETWKAYDLYSS